MKKSETTLIYGACPHDCPDTCGLVTEVAGGRAIKLGGNPNHPVTQGWLCAKVRPYLDFVYHPNRLTHPLRRVGPKGSGQFARISWDEALAEISERWQAIIREYGAEAILPYSYSGTLGLIQMKIASSRFWNRLGASQLERTICDAAAKIAVRATLGARIMQPYAEVEQSQLVIIWGHNPVSTAPHFMPPLRNAQRNGAKLVVIDPRRTRTAKSADWHIAPLPGTDGALALGLGHVMVAEGLHDETWLQANTVGWPQFRERLQEYPPERVAGITGVPPQQIIELGRLYATTRPSLIKIADGVQRNLTGGQNVRAICALPALVGQVGQRGGGLAYNAADTIQWDDGVVNRWDACPPPGRVINMNRLGAALTGEATDPPVKSLFVFGANPLAASPNAGLILAGLKRDDLFVVVHELFQTDTADYADIVLPATSQLEQIDLHKGSGHTVLTYNQPAIPPLAECKSNWDVMRRLAGTMGFDEPWLHESPDEIIAEMMAALAETSPAFEGITLERLKAEHSVPIALEFPIPFADLNFPTPSGKIELYSEQMAAVGLDPLPGWTERVDDASPPSVLFGEPLQVVTGAAHHFVTTSFANLPGMLKNEGDPFLEIHPDDAAARGIVDGDVVRVENGRGWCRLRAQVTDAVRPGVVASPKGRWPKLDPFADGGAGRNINWTTPDALADLGHQSTFHSNRVWVSRVAET